MTRFVHLGDIHLKQGPRNAERIRVLWQIIEDNRLHPQLGAWLLPGDIGDARLSIADTNVLDEMLTVMATHAPVILCYGNHCQKHDLDGFGRLKTHFPIFVIDTPQIVHITLATGEDAAIFVMPYPERAGLAGMGISHHDQLGAAEEALTYIFMNAGADLAEARRHGHLTAMIGHANVAGSITSSGQPQIGQEIEITADHLMRLGHCYKGLNHIHEHQCVWGAWYPGSVTPTQFGESTPRWYLVVEYEQMPDGTWDHEVMPQRIDTRALYHATGRLTLDGFTYDVTDGPGGAVQPKPDSWHNCDVKAVVSIAKSENDRLDRTLVEREFADAALVQYEYIAIPDRAVRAPEVAAERTFEGKARAWAAYNGTTLSHSLIAKLHTIANGDAQQFLAELAARLTESEQREVEAAA